MEFDSDGEVVTAWWDYMRRARGRREDRKALSLGQPAGAQAAYEAVARVVESDGRHAVELLVALTDAGPTSDDGLTVGCGPLEELLRDSGDTVAADVDDYARRSPVFARALSHVWLQRGHLGEAAENRLRPWVPSLTREH